MDSEGNQSGLYQDASGQLSKWALFYESADDVAVKAPPVFPAHLARLREFHARGELLLVGTFADPQVDGSMGIFASEEGALEFVEGDPFRLEGVIRGWRLLEWNELRLDGADRRDE
jgi:uncharacterized protein